jgi:hypothetical protein
MMAKENRIEVRNVYIWGRNQFALAPLFSHPLYMLFGHAVEKKGVEVVLFGCDPSS